MTFILEQVKLKWNVKNRFWSFSGNVLGKIEIEIVCQASGIINQEKKILDPSGEWKSNKTLLFLLLTYFRDPQSLW